MSGMAVVAAAAMLLAAGCAASPTGSASSGPGDRGSTSTKAPPALPAGTVGAAGGNGLMISVSGAGSGTSVRGFDRTTHSLVRTLELPGRYRLPVVVPAGPVEGLARDGSVLVLAADPTAATARFAVLPVALDAPARIVELPKAFSYDALAPDGATLYLIEHLGSADSQHYQVRSYDLTAQRLDDAVIVDKATIGEEMTGHPTSRVTSADGFVVATVYERVGGAPFVHVLNTTDKTALCIDLPARTRGLHLAGEGTVLTLQDPTGVGRLTVNLTTGTTASPTEACTAGVTRAALPVWARTGFTGDGSGFPHVVSTHGDMIAVLFGHPLEASPDPAVQNKILWIPRPVASSSPRPSTSSGQAVTDLALTIEAALRGTSMTLSRIVPDGPGPSGVNFPQTGCWQLTLHWYGRSDTMLLPVG
jgi:hypothetical protein